MLKDINHFILNIYQKSFCNDLASFRDHICNSLNKVLPFDSISWHYINEDGKEVASICTSSLKNEESYTFLGNLPSINSVKKTKTDLITLSRNKYQLIAFTCANNERRGQKIELIRTLNSRDYSQSDQRLFELIFPHLVEGLSMVLMNNFKERSSGQAMGIIDVNSCIIEADHNFLSLFSSKIKNNCLLLNTDLINNKQSYTLNNIDLTIYRVSDFYVIYADIEKKQELTKQEHKVMTLLSKGSTNKEIAVELSLSASTINNHLTHVFKKLHVNNRISAVQEWNKNDKYGTIS